MSASEKEKRLRALADSVVQMDEERAVKESELALEQGIPAYEAISEGLVVGMNEAGKLFEEEEYFVPELLLCSDAMYAGLEVLQPHLPSSEEGSQLRLVVGVVEGDTHDIGKNLVKIMVEAGGFEVYDLGNNVAIDRFIETACEVDAHIIALSTMMTTTMDQMPALIGRLQERGLRERFKVLVGGGPISTAYAARIGADGYAPNAARAVKVAKSLLAPLPPAERGAA